MSETPNPGDWPAQCQKEDDEDALDESVSIADGSDEGTPPSSLTQLELLQVFWKLLPLC